MLAAKADDLLGRMIALAEGGDVQALTWCCNRLLPPLKAESPPVSIKLPSGKSLAERGEHILKELASGRLSADEATGLIAALVAQCRLVEQAEIKPLLDECEEFLRQRSSQEPWRQS